MRVFPQLVDPIRLSKHLIEQHELSELTVDGLDSDELRRTHVVLHRRRCEHVHA